MLYNGFVWSNWPVQHWYSIYYPNDKHYWHWSYNNPESQQMEVKSKVKAQYLLFCCSATQIHEKWPATGSLLGCSPHPPVRAAWKSLYDVLSLTGWHHYASARLLHLWVQHFSHKASSHLNSTLKAIENIWFPGVLFHLSTLESAVISLDILTDSNMLSKYAAGRN